MRTAGLIRTIRDKAKPARAAIKRRIDKNRVKTLTNMGRCNLG
jgi:hypothetical protein